MSLANVVSDLNTAMTAAITAAEAGDYSTAYSKAEKAYGLSLQIPDESEIEGERLKWNLERIEQYMSHLRRRMGEVAASQNAASGAGSIIRPVPVTYRRETR